MSLRNIRSTVKIGEQLIGDNQPAYIVGEIGINHNGSLEIAKELVRAAFSAGLNAVKFQKRTPDLCVPAEQRNQMRDTPWGYISYIDYRYKVEFGEKEYKEIDRYCKEIGIDWFVSVWDEPSVDFMEKFNPICYKVPSASLTDLNLLHYLRDTDRPVILSTGMSTRQQIDAAVKTIGLEKLVICHSTSAYPCDPVELNLRMIETLRRPIPRPHWLLWP